MSKRELLSDGFPQPLSQHLHKSRLRKGKDGKGRYIARVSANGEIITAQIVGSAFYLFFI